MRKQILFLSAVFMINNTYADVNYRYYEKNTSNGGANGYACVDEWQGSIMVKLGTVERRCQYYRLDCEDPGIAACVFSVPPSRFYMPDVDLQVAQSIEAGITSGQFYLDQSFGQGNVASASGSGDLSNYSWTQQGAVTKIVVLEQSEQ